MKKEDPEKVKAYLREVIPVIVIMLLFIFVSVKGWYEDLLFFLLGLNFLSPLVICSIILLLFIIIVVRKVSIRENILTLIRKIITKIKR